MKFHILTLFPSMFDSVLSQSILGRAVRDGLVEVECHDIREFATDKHRTVDDSPFGGGAGMVMMPGPIVDAIQSIKARASVSKTILLSAAGRSFDQSYARALAENDGTVLLICGRYEGVDARVGQHYCDDELSVGDYVLSGGEIAAMAIVDAVTRLIPGALGNRESPVEESQEGGVLEYPQYTRPRCFEGHDVPAVLLGGNHNSIRQWRRQQALFRTRSYRPDLFGRLQLSEQDKKLLD